MPSTLRGPIASAAHAFTLFSLLVATAYAHADSMESQPLQKRALTDIGCYSSSTPLDLVASYQYQSSGWCGGKCSKAVIGLTGGDTCYCGDEIPATADKVDSSKCNIKCTGYGVEMCGGDGFWTIYTTGTESNVPTYSSSSSGSKTSTKSPTLVTSQIPGGSTVIVVTVQPSSTDGAGSSGGGGGGGGGSTAGIAAGVVVGVLALAGIVAGVYFFLRHRKSKQAEQDFKQRTQVADFMRGSNERKPPGTGYSGMSDSRLDPEAGRRNSVGSLADNQDYSRRILRVANPDDS